MRIGERVAPVLAAISAVATLACCLPIGGVALLGLGGLLGAVGRYQQWFLPASGVLLVAGGVLIWRSRRVCHRTSTVSVIILALSAAIVLLVLLFPQTVAGLLTDWFS
jgi:cytochrome bd-type quinol oxidase subunit 2